MIGLIENKSEDPRLAALNTKIAVYNQLAEKNNNLSLQITLLQEINAFSTTLQSIALTEEFSPLLILCHWSSITDELIRLSPEQSVPLPGLAAEMRFFELTHAQRQSSSGTNTSSLNLINKIQHLFSKKHPKLKQLQDDVQQSTKIEHQSGDLRYFFHLKKIKEALLHIINFEQPTLVEQQNARDLIQDIDERLYDIIQHDSVLQAHYQEHQSMAPFFRWYLEDATNKEKNTLIETLLNPQSFSTPNTSLPQLSHFDIKSLSSGNNKSWLLQPNQNQGSAFILRVEFMNDATLLQKLEKTPVSLFLAQDYTQAASSDMGYRIIVSEYAPKSDLRTNRTKKDKHRTEGSIIQSALSHVEQIIECSQLLLRNNAMHTDIKLSNFLLRENGRIIMADKKAILPIVDGQIPISSITTTAQYAPPEYLGQIKSFAPSKEPSIHAEQFMCYQIGVALYDYLVAPSEEMWVNNGLDFNYPIFKSAIGEQLKILIEKATSPILDHSDDSRITLAALHTQIEKFQAQPHFLLMALDSKKMLDPAQNTHHQLQSRTKLQQNFKMIHVHIQNMEAILKLLDNKSLSPTEQQTILAQFTELDSHVTTELHDAKIFLEQPENQGNPKDLPHYEMLHAKHADLIKHYEYNASQKRDSSFYIDIYAQIDKLSLALQKLEFQFPHKKPLIQAITSQIYQYEHGKITLAMLRNQCDELIKNELDLPPSRVDNALSSIKTILRAFTDLCSWILLHRSSFDKEETMIAASEIEIIRQLSIFSETLHCIEDVKSQPNSSYAS